VSIFGKYPLIIPTLRMCRPRGTRRSGKKKKKRRKVLTDASSLYTSSAATSSFVRQKEEQSRGKRKRKSRRRHLLFKSEGRRNLGHCLHPLDLRYILKKREIPFSLMSHLFQKKHAQSLTGSSAGTRECSKYEKGGGGEEDRSRRSLPIASNSSPISCLLVSVEQGKGKKRRNS